MKLEVGMYVRTKNNGISKIKGFHSNVYEDYITISNCFDLVRKKDILKASHNIIDLIEVGDLVTLNSKYCDGEIYQVVQKSDDIIGLDCFQDGTMYVDKTEKDDIKSIVTKEQFESMEYKVC